MSNYILVDGELSGESSDFLVLDWRVQRHTIVGH